MNPNSARGGLKRGKLIPESIETRISYIILPINIGEEEKKRKSN